MKTIMQELVDIMNSDQVSFTEWFQDNYQMLIEKEKEQIMEAYGRAICMFYESEQPEEYYNETFNHLHIVTNGKVGLSNPDETTNNELNVNQKK
jgi:hypothetical protein